MAGVRAQRKAERPGEILEAAFEEFVRKGYEATRLEDVAARVGVTKGTIYFYFGSKERVFAAAIQEVSRDPFAEFTGADADWTGDLATDLRAFLGRLDRFCAQNPRSRETLRLLIAEASRFPELVDLHFERFMKPCIDRLTERLADAVGRGEIGSLPAKEAAEVALGPILAANILTLLFEDRRPLDRERFLEIHLTLLLDGLRPRAIADEAVERPEGPRSPADPPDGWSSWRRFPDPRLGEMLTAPAGPGAFELRLSSGELLMAGAGPGTASRLAMLLPRDLKPARRRSSSKRAYLLAHLDQVEYRTRGHATVQEAKGLLATLDRRRYRFPHE